MIKSLISELLKTFIVWLVTASVKWLRQNLQNPKPSQKETKESLRAYFLQMLFLGLLCFAGFIHIPDGWPFSICVALILFSAGFFSSCWIAFEMALVFDPGPHAGEQIPPQGTAQDSPQK